jgi:glycosyltransferase involved in cell wall biosynthesis
MIPTYNQAAFIREAIDSALAQTYPNLEVIVGDDASTDATPEIVAKINDPRLKYVRNTCNLGRATNYRNLLYNHATGDYVVNLDGDDYYTAPDFITEAVSCISGKMEVVMVVARATTKTQNGEWVSEIPNIQECTGLQILSKLPRREYMVMHMAVLYSRRHALEASFYRSDAISSDWESLYRLSLRGAVRYLDKNIGVWRQHEANETGTSDSVKLLANLRVWESVYREAIIFGMSKWRAKITCARCVANYASASCIKLSRLNKKRLIEFIFLVVKEFRLSAICFFIYPKYGARIVLSLLGYYAHARS